MKQNITLSLEKELLQQIKILAAQKSTSISALLTAELERLVKKDDAYQQAMEQALASMEKGYDFGGGNYLTREEMYDRKKFR
jgi:capsule polysaccharide export protein KpsE/RkpR